MNRKGMTLPEVLVTMLIMAIIMSALFSFFLGASRSAVLNRRTAFQGQSVERAMTLLRWELAGALDLMREEDTNLLEYIRVRDNQWWVLELVDGTLQRRPKGAGDPVVIAGDIDEFIFVLPNEDEFGTANPGMIGVILRAGIIMSEDNIFLRNYKGP